METKLKALQEELAWLQKEQQNIGDQIRACRRAKGLTTCDDCEACIPKYCGLWYDWRQNRKQQTTVLVEIHKN